jgi:hypothetical protein
MSGALLIKYSVKHYANGSIRYALDLHFLFWGGFDEAFSFV